MDGDSLVVSACTVGSAKNIPYCVLRLLVASDLGSSARYIKNTLHRHRCRSARPWAMPSLAVVRVAHAGARIDQRRPQTNKQRASKKANTKPNHSHYIREAHAALDGAIVVVGRHEAGGDDAGRREEFPHAIGGVRVVVAELPRLLARVVAHDY